MQCVKYIGTCGNLFPSAWIGDTYNGVYDCSNGGGNPIYCQTNCNCSQPTLSCSNLVNSSVSPSTVPSGGGQLVNVGCNFGDGDYPCIQASINGSSCNFQNWTGTTANFSCAAPATAGSYNISCDLVNDATYCPNQTPYNCPGVALVVERSCTTTAPTNPTVTNITTSSARLNWTPGTGGGSQLFRFDTSEYKVENACPGGCMVSATLDSGVNFYDISGLSPNTIYYWRVVEYLDSSDWTDFGNQCLISTSGSVFFTTSSTPVSSWWQVKDGDITTLGSIQSAVYTTNFFNLDGLGGFPGIPVYGTGQTLSFAPGGLSSPLCLSG
jgi:hypothetical protein